MSYNKNQPGLMKTHVQLPRGPAKGERRQRSRSRSKNRAKTPARRRSVSKGPASGDGGHKEVALARQAAKLVVADRLYPAVKSIIQSRAFAKEGYFGVQLDEKKDFKSDPSVDLLLSQLDNARSVVRAGLKERPIRLDLVVESSAALFLVTVTSGVMANVQSVDPSATTEWSSVAALFEEYKVLGTETYFAVQDGSPAGTAVSNGLIVLAYDPVSATALSSTLAGTTVAEHKVFAATPTTSSAPPTSGGRPYHFRSHVPSGIILAASTLEGSWSMTSSPQPYGYLKSYWVSGTATAHNAAFAYTVIHCEFRCRA